MECRATNCLIRSHERGGRRVPRLLLRGLAVVTLAAIGCTPTHGSYSASTAPVASVIVNPASDSLLVGDSQRLIALLKDGRGRPRAAHEVSWASLTPETATVSPSGIVSGHTPGIAQIVATSEGRTGAAVITVLLPRNDVAECEAPKPGWIWCDDFEKDRLGSYFEYGSIGKDFVRLPGPASTSAAENNTSVSPNRAARDRSISSAWLL